MMNLGFLNLGNKESQKSLINYVENADMQNPDVYDSLSNWIDIDNHIDYKFLHSQHLMG